MEQRRLKRKTTGQLSGMQVMFAAVLAIGLILAISFSSRITENQPLQETRNDVQRQIEELREIQATLVAERDFVASDAYVEQWARDEGKMVRPGEHLVIPVPSGINIEATPVPEINVPIQTAPPEKKPWELWWLLFFDSDPPQF
ncbi:MAG: hypothetical protein D6737_03500 [Chloroflexi bacterium]|nr:MAG: hypothetical protein CUN54_04145 [Phototrophicales bacterium]RMF81946.1 MAG: hypothetical protein D6737_03500 [Chloroflexota bacterium]